jgi:nucleoid DNA-binding protein
MNPVTKSPMKIGASVTCGFKPAQSLRDSL